MVLVEHDIQPWKSLCETDIDKIQREYLGKGQFFTKQYWIISLSTLKKKPTLLCYIIKYSKQPTRVPAWVWPRFIALMLQSWTSLTWGRRRVSWDWDRTRGYMWGVMRGGDFLYIALGSHHPHWVQTFHCGCFKTTHIHVVNPYPLLCREA